MKIRIKTNSTTNPPYDVLNVENVISVKKGRKYFSFWTKTKNKKNQSYVELKDIESMVLTF